MDRSRGRADVLDLGSGHETLLGGDTWTSTPIFAPEGTRLAYFAAKNGSQAVQNDLVAAQAADSRTVDAADGVDRDFQWFAWMPGGKALAFSAADRVSVALWIGGPGALAHRVDLGAVEFENGSIARDGAIAFTGTTPSMPSVLYYLAPGTHAVKRLTNYNSWITALRLGEPREFTWRNGGFDEDGALTYPVGYVKGRTYPLVLGIHGGPTQSCVFRRVFFVARRARGPRILRTAAQLPRQR